MFMNICGWELHHMTKYKMLITWTKFSLQLKLSFWVTLFKHAGYTLWYMWFIKVLKFRFFQACIGKIPFFNHLRCFIKTAPLWGEVRWVKSPKLIAHNPFPSKWENWRTSRCWSPYSRPIQFNHDLTWRDLQIIGSEKIQRVKKSC